MAGRIVRPMTIHSDAWPAFVAEIPAIKSADLQGDALWDRIERAWAPLFEGVCESDGARLYEDAMHRLAAAGVVPRDWLLGI
jgi:hypothetical protein